MKSLSEIPRSDLEEYIFPGTDAAVLLVEKMLPQKELEELFSDLSTQHRFYPTETGWKIKFPYWHVKELLETGNVALGTDFKREEKGWDHEHCSFCHEHIHIGGLSYTADHENGGVYIICQKCAEKCP
ncbi:MAG TPA: hypothetical protein VNQ90_07645 [Chthoniobacteraceae bacterium]|nr:hypothetical protein [Chthoniobacteraceae bacterium]